MTFSGLHFSGGRTTLAPTVVIVPSEGRKGMSDLQGALSELWDRAVLLAERVDPADWSAPTPCPGMDVGELVGHMAVAGRVGAAGQERLLAALRAARQREAEEIAELARAAGTPGPAARQLAARCLDMWVHVYDLATALDEPVDLDEASPALAEACATTLRYTPRLFTSRVGAAEGEAVRIRVHGALEHEATMRVRDGRAQWTEDTDEVGGTVSGTAGAFVLLLSGRGGPQQWRAADSLEWSGASGEAFVGRARLIG